MRSNKPYLLHALYEWIIDNDCTPFLMLDASSPQVQVPQQYIDDGKIVLNIAPGAISNLQITNSTVSFATRFSGRQYSIFAPVEAVLAIYAMENGQGMMFESEPIPEEIEDGGDDSSSSSSKASTGLHIVE